MSLSLSRHTFAALLFLAACSSSATTDVNSTGTLQIQGAAMSGWGQNIRVTKNGAAATGLTVTVNGTAMPETSAGTYGGALGTPLTAGSAIEVRATDGTLTAIGDATIPAQPTVTSVESTTLGAPVTIHWSVASDPDSFSVSLNYHLPDNSAVAVMARLAGSARQVILQTSDIPANGVVYSVGVEAFVRGSFHGDAASTSDMHVRTSSPSLGYTLQ